MAAHATDVMPIAMALAMGAIATEFVLPTSAPEEIVREFALDTKDWELDYSEPVAAIDTRSVTKPDTTVSQRNPAE